MKSYYIYFIIFLISGCFNEQKNNLVNQTFSKCNNTKFLEISNFKANVIYCYDFIDSNVFFIEYNFNIRNLDNKNFILNVKKENFNCDFNLSHKLKSKRTWGTHGGGGSYCEFFMFDTFTKVSLRKNEVFQIKTIYQFINHNNYLEKVDSFSIEIPNNDKSNYCSIVYKLSKNQLQISDIKNHKYIIDYFKRTKNTISK
jgi:hypothetical protein